MNNNQPTKFIAILLLLAASTTTQAALFDRGNGLIYDDVLNATWLQDANLAASNTFGVGGINADGRMNWFTANSWIGAMNTVGGAGYKGYNDWRLPGGFPDVSTISCSGVCGDSELSYMYYSNMAAAPFSGILAGSDIGNLALFSNLQSADYWSGVVALGGGFPTAWEFSTQSGAQASFFIGAQLHVWAIRSGDVAFTSAVPIPAAFWLFGNALIGLVALKRKR